MTVFENRVLIRIFGPKRDKVTGEWRKLHIEELHSLYTSQYTIRLMKSRRMRWTGDVACMKEDRKVHKVLVVNPEEKDDSEDRGEKGIRMGFREIGCRRGG
jgi:hypothetical protein